MGQLFLWTQKTDSRQREQFYAQYGFELPEVFLDMYENLPDEFIEFLGFFKLEALLAEERRPLSLMPGLVPFATERDGDLYCFYLPWQGSDRRPPLGIWHHESNHFLPLTRSPRAFMCFWLVKEVLESLSGGEWDEMRKIIELFQSSIGMEDFDIFEQPPGTALAWNEQLLLQDDLATFPLTFIAKQQYAVEGYAASLNRLARAEKDMPGFGAPALWSARLWAQSGHLDAAHEAYWRHLQTPMFANGYHYWWNLGDLQIAEFSEEEAVRFFLEAQIPAPKHILDQPKVRFLNEKDGRDYRTRLELARLLESQGDSEGALLELENALFLQFWDDQVAAELLERLLCLYPESGRLNEAEQCRRALRSHLKF